MSKRGGDKQHVTLAAWTVKAEAHGAGASVLRCSPMHTTAGKNSDKTPTVVILGSGLLGKVFPLS